jgi:hypothetical protein
VQHVEFEGPLFGAWGERMREPALRESLTDAASRFGLPTVQDRGRWRNAHAATIARLRAEAESERGTPWPNALASQFARYTRDGDRAEYESRVFARQDRLTRAALMAAHTDDASWLDEVVDGVIVLCEQSTWAWAAHDDAHSSRGFVLPDVERPYLDLGAGEVVAQLALVDHVLGARLEERWPGVRERIRHEANARVLGPFRDRDDFWWLGYWRDVNNWNPWIIGNVITAAVLLIDDAEKAAAILARGLESLDRFVAVLPEDGAIDEGFSYWWNGAARLLECLDVVHRVTGGALDPRTVPVLREVLRYPYRMQLGGDWYVNVADGRARTLGGEPWHVPFRWGAMLGDDAVAAHARSARPAGAVVAASAGLGRALHALADEEWCQARGGPATQEAGAAPLPAHVWLPSVQLFVARPEAGSDRGLTLMAKGGHNDENHNHKDVGSFIVALDGRPAVIDIGKPTYTAQTFSADRYENRVMQSGWHNAPAPYGLEQGEGVAFAATVLRAPAPEAPELELELAAAYPLPAGASWRRTCALDRSTGRVTVSDAWCLTPADACAKPAAGAAAEPAAPAAGAAQATAAEPVDAAEGEAGTTLHLVLAGEVTRDGGDVVVRPAGVASALRVHTEPEARFELEEWLLDDPELIEIWGERLTRATIRAPHSGAGAIETIFEVVR